ncbi:MAG: GspH/FimT family pseudopilin [Planctomycetota bacterium]|nr:GspH/FimT family pseudopilin [Planctomycetota bacterium]
MKAARRAGFTLIEIVVVLVIISMLLGTALTNMKGLVPAAATESAAQDVVAKLDFARTQAVARGYSYDVLFDLDEQRYTIRTPFDEEGAPTTDLDERSMLRWAKLADGAVLVAVYDSTGIRRERGVWTLTFHPAGEATDFWAYVSHRANEDAYMTTVRVLGLTGLASVMAGEVTPPRVVENDF